MKNKKLPNKEGSFNLASSIVALINRFGGLLLIGINNEQRIVESGSIDNYEDIIIRISAITREQISPPVLLDHELITCKEGDVIALYVPRRKTIPHSVKITQKIGKKSIPGNAYYVRTDSGKRQANDLLAPYSDRYTISIDDFSRIKKINNQWRFWTYRRAREVYQCNNCNKTIIKSGKYFSFFKKRIMKIFFCISCFRKYKNYNEDRFGNPIEDISQDYYQSHYWKSFKTQYLYYCMNCNKIIHKGFDYQKYEFNKSQYISCNECYIEKFLFT
ncbi:MAG: hypothetical protein HeimC3_32430 [Candidatus Heimdallarchaeota archaeon LC_3]|nr:MAG: hypothetical protein HeimC3_32430 [Candidatus Heimdallarchaeota archaeon LC_3]